MQSVRRAMPLLMMPLLMMSLWCAACTSSQDDIARIRVRVAAARGARRATADRVHDSLRDRALGGRERDRIHQRQRPWKKRRTSRRSR